MPRVRETAYAMADAGRLEVTQSGGVVDGRTARGAIRLRLPLALSADGPGAGPWRSSSAAARRSCSASGACGGVALAAEPLPRRRGNWYLPR